MGRLFELVEAHRRRQPYPPSYAQIAGKVNVSRQTLLNWRDPHKLPDRAHLEQLAEVIGVDYLRVLDAALHDAGYLPATKRREARLGSSVREVDATASASGVRSPGGKGQGRR